MREIIAWTTSFVVHAGTLAWMGWWNFVEIRPDIARSGGRSAIELVVVAPQPEEFELDLPESPELILETSESRPKLAETLLERQPPEQRLPSESIPPHEVAEVAQAVAPRLTPADAPEPAAPQERASLPPMLPRRVSPPPPPVTPQVVIPKLTGFEIDEPPKKWVENRPPTYPAAALLQGIEGRVLLRVFVSAEGEVLSAEVKQASGHAMLDEAALKAVRAWQFDPAMRGGSPVECHVIIPVNFTIRSG